MGFLDRAKQLAEQARSKAEEALAEVSKRTAAMSRSPGATAPPGAPSDPRMGTPYIPGMLGRPGWRERGLADPAAVLPVAARDRVGVLHSTKSQIVAEPFGVGRRWSSGGRSAGLFYQMDASQRDWQPPLGSAPLPDVPNAWMASLPDGTSLVFLGGGGNRVVLELKGLDDARTELIHAVLGQLDG